MTAQKLVGIVREAKATYVVLGAVSGAILVGASLPGQVRVVEARVGVVEADVRTLRETLDRRDRYAFCRWQAEDEGLDPRICSQLMPESFLPGR